MNARTRRFGLVAATLLVATPARAQDRPLDLDAVLAPVIGLEAFVPQGARSAPTLGTERGATAVVIDASGLALTIGYAILDAERVELLPGGLGGPRVAADVVAWDHATGIGLVRARAVLGVPSMPLGESSALDVDDAVIVASWERRDGMLPALVTGRRPYAGYWEYLLEDALYVAPIHPAFPGAALIGLDGTLLGIGGFASFDSVDQELIADTVFIPIDTVKSVLAELLLHGRSGGRRAWLGLYCEQSDSGLRVRRVPAYGPAARAGVRPGDRLVAVAGAPIASLEGFYRLLWSTARPGDRVRLDLERDGAALAVDVEASDRYDSLR